MEDLGLKIVRNSNLRFENNKVICFFERGVSTSSGLPMPDTFLQCGEKKDIRLCKDYPQLCEKTLDY